MIIQGNGLQLTRLKGGDIEMLRKWRNSPGIKRYMIFKGQITPEMQQQWFRSVDNISNHYLIIEFRGSKIGLAKIANINDLEGDAEAGIFIWDKKHLGSRVPVIASTATVMKLQERVAELEAMVARISVNLDLVTR